MHTHLKVPIYAVLAGFCITQAQAQALPSSQLNNPWFVEAQQHVNSRASLASADTAKNLILFVGDGMGIATLTAARIYGGQQEGGLGEENILSFERFEHTALVKTYNTDAQIPDSAGTMTAMMSGLKTNAGLVGVHPSVRRGNCEAVADNELPAVVELAEIKGLSTGVVSTARITHATPAATYAKSADRSWEDISDIPENAVAQGCVDIAKQLIDFESNTERRFPNMDVDGIDVVLGGGRRHFLPSNPSSDLVNTFGQASGDRTDAINLIEQWQQLYPQGRYVFDEAGLDSLDMNAEQRVFGLFNSSHMEYDAQRTESSGREPSLSKMTRKAIELLDNNANGFVLIVEAGRIDHSHHAGNAYGALNETVELARAVSVAQDMTNSADTLIMVTADHSHVMTISGYPARGNPILGKVQSKGGDSPALASDGLPHTTLGYTNGPGFRDYGDNTNPDRTYADGSVAGRQNLSQVNTRASGFHQETLVPLVAETHGGEDVSVHATGPGAFRAQGTIEQSQIFHIIDKALRLTE